MCNCDVAYKLKEKINNGEISYLEALSGDPFIEQISFNGYQGAYQANIVEGVRFEDGSVLIKVSGLPFDCIAFTKDEFLRTSMAMAS